MTKVKIDDFVACISGLGHRIDRERKQEPHSTRFPEGSIGKVLDARDDLLIVYVIGQDYDFVVPADKVELVDVFKTGKGHGKMICNICHVLKNEKEFARNQTDAKGKITRRPTCMHCRRDIEQKGMTSKEKKEADKERPKKGAIFRCPICKKRGIVGVNVSVVLDHRRSTGTARTFLCDSCNTGLGRFKNGENYLKNALDYLEKFEEKEKK